MSKLPFQKLSSIHLEDFVRANGQVPVTELSYSQAGKFMSKSDLAKQVERIFNSEPVEYTEPIIDLYIAFQIDPEDIPQTYTPRDIVRMTDEERTQFSEFFLVPDDPHFDTRIVRILGLLDKIIPTNSPEDQILFKALPDKNFYSDELFNQAIQKDDLESVQRWFKYVKDERQELFEELAESGKVDLLTSVKEKYPEDWTDLIFRNFNNLFDSVIESGSFGMIRLILNDYDPTNLDSDEYADLMTPLVKTGNVEWVKQLAPDLIPNQTIYFTAIDSGSIPMLEYIQILPLIAPENLEYWSEEDIAEVESEVDYPVLVKYAAENSSPLLNYLLDACPDCVDDALIGAILNFHPDLTTIQDLVQRGAQNLEWAILTTSDQEIFEWLVDQQDWSPEQLTQILINSATFNDPNLLIKIINLGANISESVLRKTSDLKVFRWLLDQQNWSPEQLTQILANSVRFSHPELTTQIIDSGAQDLYPALVNAVKQFKSSLIPILMERGQFTEQQYQQILTSELLKAVERSDDQTILRLAQIGAENLNEGLRLAAQLGRIKLMKILIDLGATNLKEAYQSASPEKQGWIKREFSQYL